MATLLDLAKEIMECEFDNDSDLNSLQSIECWLEANLGRLNTLIDAEFCLEGLELDSEASAIYKQLYLHQYYVKKTRNAMRGVMACSDTSNPDGEITSLSDGESRVTFANKNETAKVIRGMAQDAKVALDQLVNKYNIYQSEPRQVGGIEA
tara:strand:- start:141 stop:593 length:453 start_codon:yes stop_codon:yes gene_type:complete